ncbi:MAG TPA: GNAT family N-acetyltransferase [Candidatus Baltobacteraceae bacterium]
MALEPVSLANSAQADAFLALRPYENIYLRWLIESRATTHLGRTVCYLSRDEERAVDGVGYFGPQFVLSGASDAALRDFEHVARSMPQPRMIVGPRLAIESWWEDLRLWHRVPRAVREHQPVYALTRATLRGSRADADVGQATAAELDEIARESAAMIEHETGIDPWVNHREFRERTARVIRAGWWWRWREQGALRFQCSIGAQLASTAQIQGVWTPVAQREQGYATRALGATCDHLLDQLPSLCLYVNDFNVPAVALYERLGFENVGEFMTLLF